MSGRLPKELRSPSLRELARRLRKHAPTKAPVRIIRQRGVRCDGGLVLGVISYKIHWRGGCPRRIERYRIVIDSRLSAGEQWDCLVHEWAHALDRETRPKRPKDCHDSRWGQCYARAFRASHAS